MNKMFVLRMGFVGPRDRNFSAASPGACKNFKFSDRVVYDARDGGIRSKLVCKHPMASYRGSDKVPENGICKKWERKELV